ncbi:MAG: gliding motility-associated C-terminal domain-containing protein [Chitinophagales bacterium]|nr:gliding motility-associated C-terminal domain-containing protein [Chitinophagales bacterium]
MSSVKAYIIPLLLALTNLLHAQTSANSGGGSLNNTTIAVDYAVGQVAIATLENQNRFFTQGLLQPDPLIDCSQVQINTLPDSFILALDDGQLSFDPLLNDNLPFEVKINAVSTPLVGQVTPGSPGNVWTYRINEPQFSGFISFSYTLCPILCPGACDSSTVSIRVVSGIPNVITPNADGVNDTFDPLQTLRELGITTLPKSFNILSRSGEIIWSAAPYRAWDARNKKHYVEEGAYYYLLLMEDGQVFKGPISVVRYE